MQQTDLAGEMTGTCLMARARFLSRVLTTRYDEALRPFGIQASQLPLLAVIARFGPARRTDLGRLLHFDSSTLTRNLRVMLANDWIEEVPAAPNGKGRALRLTPSGTALLHAAGPAWRRAQAEARLLLGGDGEAAILRLFDTLQQADA